MLVPFPFSDLSQAKLRPGAVLADAGRGDWILCQITSNPYGDPGALGLTDESFERGSLHRASFVRPGKLFTANRDLMVSEVGGLNTDRGISPTYCNRCRDSRGGPKSVNAMPTESGGECGSGGKLRFPTETPEQLRQRIRWLRSLTLEQRGEMIIAACRAAMKIEQARIQSGLPPTKPASWPASTLEFLKKHARRCREPRIPEQDQPTSETRAESD